MLTWSTTFREKNFFDWSSSLPDEWNLVGCCCLHGQSCEIQWKCEVCTSCSICFIKNIGKGGKQPRTSEKAKPLPNRNAEKVGQNSFRRLQRLPNVSTLEHHTAHCTFLNSYQFWSGSIFLDVEIGPTFWPMGPRLNLKLSVIDETFCTCSKLSWR